MEKDTEQLVSEEMDWGAAPDLLPVETPAEHIQPYEDATEVDG